MYKHKYLKLIQFQIFILPLQCVSLTPIDNKTSGSNETSFTEHLKIERVKDMCARKDTICESSRKYYLCTIRVENGKMMTKDFDNYCSYFLVNMCDYPGKEWAIKDVGSCKNVNLRRFQEHVENTTPSNDAENVTDDTVTEGEAVTEGDAATEGEAVTEGEEEAANELEEEAVTEIEDLPNLTDEEASTTVPALRNLEIVKYGVDEAADDHPCPQFCTNLYSPVCVNVNRRRGRYYKLLFFVNHCEADRHYCSFYNTVYTPPPDYNYESVHKPSNIAWSNCASSRYMNFASFSEAASSLVHYGWLHGSQRPEHIMEPWERSPGFG